MKMPAKVGKIKIYGCEKQVFNKSNIMCVIIEYNMLNKISIINASLVQIEDVRSSEMESLDLTERSMNEAKSENGLDEISMNGFNNTHNGQISRDSPTGELEIDEDEEVCIKTEVTEIIDQESSTAVSMLPDTSKLSEIPKTNFSTILDNRGLWLKLYSAESASNILYSHETQVLGKILLLN